MQFPHPLELKAKRRRIAAIGAGIALLLALLVYLVWPTEPREGLSRASPTRSQAGK